MINKDQYEYSTPPETILSSVDGFWRFDDEPIDDYTVNAITLEACGMLDSKKWVWMKRGVTQWHLNAAGKAKLAEHREYSANKHALVMALMAARDSAISRGYPANEDALTSDPDYWKARCNLNIFKQTGIMPK